MAPSSPRHCYCNRTLCQCSGSPNGYVIDVANEDPKPKPFSRSDVESGWRAPKHGKHARQRK